MEFVSKLLQGLSFVPGVVEGIEGLFRDHSGTEKRGAALSFLQETLSISQALASRHITDEEKFKTGLGKMIDGAVDCLNASAWAREKSASS